MAKWSALAGFAATVWATSAFALTITPAPGAPVAYEAGKIVSVSTKAASEVRLIVVQPTVNQSRRPRMLVTVTNRTGAPVNLTPASFLISTDDNKPLAALTVDQVQTELSGAIAAAERRQRIMGALFGGDNYATTATTNTIASITGTGGFASGSAESTTVIRNPAAEALARQADAQAAAAAAAQAQQQIAATRAEIDQTALVSQTVQDGQSYTSPLLIDTLPRRATKLSVTVLVGVDLHTFLYSLSER